MPKFLIEKTAVRVLTVVLGFVLEANAAGPATFSYRGGGQGSVIFDHGVHASQGYVCDDCHTKCASNGKQLFQTRRQGHIDAAVHNQGESCFACHNGSVAFYECASCHRHA
jgi:c(7)-type cytochrome triheme protein